MSKTISLVEPLMSNRWVISTEGLEINSYLFRNYTIFNEGEDIIFKTEFFETVLHSYNPKDILNITKVKIEYLDPTGKCVNGLTFEPKGINFKRKHSYSDSNLMVTKLRLIIDTKKLALLSKTEENGE
jgi:hypothetical protein